MNQLMSVRALTRPFEATWDLPALTAPQRQALADVELLSAAGPATCLFGASGIGKTVVLKEFARRHGAEWLSSDLCLHTIDVGDQYAPLDALLATIERAFKGTDLLVIDDIFANFLHWRNKDQMDFDEHALRWKRLLEILLESGKRLVFGSQVQLDASLQIVHVEVGALRAPDYALVSGNLLGAERAADIDFAIVYRFAAGLTPRELETICQSFAPQETPTTGTFIEALKSFGISANTLTHEVEEVTFDGLPGAEHIASKLETHIILPLENHALAQELDIRPKRGVLLYGPPGTGKTSIGRALAHRMKGKFFLIDGSFETERPTKFFSGVAGVVEAAKEHAPSVLFIDDADVLFTIPEIAGFSRYLLSLLDGLEGETANKVCLMMTAMDVRKVPAAILRSGRVELWLETRAPDAEVRGRILKRWMAKDLPGAEAINYPSLAALAAGFTPADLRRIASDAKAYYVADKVAGRKLATAEDYLRTAIEASIASRNRMADNLNDETMRVGAAINKTAAKYASGIGGLVESQSSCPTAWW